MPAEVPRIDAVDQILLESKRTRRRIWGSKCPIQRTIRNLKQIFPTLFSVGMQMSRAVLTQNGKDSAHGPHDKRYSN